MAFDGLVTKSIVTELNNIILDAKVNKIYQPNKNSIVLDIYNKKKMLLNICIDSANCRINLTNNTKPNPKTAPNFCMVLRKYLTNSKIVSIQTHSLDRIAIITFECFNELNDKINYKLIVELMGKHSNIILLNNKDIIIDSLRHINSNSSFRNILPANPYYFPETSKLDLQTISLDNFILQINSVQTHNLIDACSLLFTGISKTFMLFTIDKLNINNILYTQEELTTLYRYLKHIIECISMQKICCVNFNSNNKMDFTITLKTNSSIFSVNNFIDEFYTKKENYENFTAYRNSVLKLILAMLSKYNKKIFYINQKLVECKKMNTYRLYGELITANLYKINNKINLPSIDLENYYDNGNIISIPLDIKFSPSFNAKNYFKKYNKLKHTLEIVTEQKKQISNNISYLESIIYSLESSTSIVEIDEIYEEISETLLLKSNSNITKNYKNKTLEIYSQVIDNFTIYIGKNNKQNDYISFKLANKDDIWFHVQGFHGSHVVLKTNGNQISEDNPILLKCAKLAAINSKAINENKVLVDYTQIKNLKKPKGSKPGFVVFNNFKTIVVEL